MDSLSKFKNYLKGWDYNIESLDDVDTKNKMIAILDQSLSVINLHLSEHEMKCLENDKKNNTNSFINLTESKKYKEFKRNADNLLWMRYTINNLFEIKHRRTKQNLDLRAELAELKIKNK